VAVWLSASLTLTATVGQTLLSEADARIGVVGSKCCDAADASRLARAPLAVGEDDGLDPIAAFALHVNGTVYRPFAAAVDGADIDRRLVDEQSPSRRRSRGGGP